MYSVNSQNPFGGLPMDTKDMMEFGQRRFNPIMGVMSPAYIPYSQPSEETTRMLRQATNNVDVRADSATNSALKISPQYNPISVPNDRDSRLRRAIEVCEAVKNNDCSAFKNPKFQENCVMSHEPNGKNSRGEAHMGGFVLFKEDREQQLDAARGGFPVFKATIGELPKAGDKYPQRVSYDEKSCEIVKKRINCETTQKYGNGCGVCFNTDDSYYVDEAAKQSSSLIIAGYGNYRMFDDRGVELSSGQLKSSEGSEIRLPPDAEGKTFSLEVSSPDTQAFVGGYLMGMTRNGANRTDLRFMTQNDKETKTKPVTAGVVEVKYNNITERMSKIRTGFGKKMMRIDVYIPFTFIESNEPINFYCQNAPFNTSQTTATFLGRDPCYKRRPDGSLSLECIQDRFVGVGCVQIGLDADGKVINTDYPTTEEMADKWRKANGKNLSLQDITQNMYDLYLKAKLGRDPSGAEFSTDPKAKLEIWNDYSMRCLAKKITTPCDQYDMQNGPLGDDCLMFLYNDNGRGKAIGGTYNYTTPTYTSLKIKENMDSTFEGNYDPRQCTPTGSMYPVPGSSAADVARSKGGVSAVKKFYNDIHMQANSTNLKMTDNMRDNYMQQCYGIQLAKDTRTEGFAGRRY